MVILLGNTNVLLVVSFWSFKSAFTAKFNVQPLTPLGLLLEFVSILQPGQASLAAYSTRRSVLPDLSSNSHRAFINCSPVSKLFELGSRVNTAFWGTASVCPFMIPNRRRKTLQSEQWQFCARDL
jgi:hypothetical protein